MTLYGTYVDRTYVHTYVFATRKCRLTPIMVSKTTRFSSFFGLECMECMVKVVKPFYAIKCMVGWLGYTMLRMHVEDV